MVADVVQADVATLYRHDQLLGLPALVVEKVVDVPVDARVRALPIVRLSLTI
ncbi:MAG: hypothetical protein HY508_14365 [Acidobacteria bacterium]|nr:hypothetical protein [Acidobacteriota bacterium]